MKLEEFKKFMETEEFKEIAKSLNLKTEADVQDLIANRDKVIGEKRRLQAKIDELEAKYADFDPEEYEALKKGASGKGDAGAQDKRELEKLMKKLEAEAAARAQVEKDLNETLVSTEILKALGKNNIDKKHHGLLLDAFAGKAKVEVSDGSRTVLIGDDSVFDFFDKYAKGDGQIYVEQQENRGAGSQRMSTTTKKVTEAQFNQMPAKERAAFVANGGTVE